MMSSRDFGDLERARKSVKPHADEREGGQNFSAREQSILLVDYLLAMICYIRQHH